MDGTSALGMMTPMSFCILLSHHHNTCIPVPGWQKTFLNFLLIMNITMVLLQFQINQTTYNQFSIDIYFLLTLLKRQWPGFHRSRILRHGKNQQ